MTDSAPAPWLATMSSLDGTKFAPGGPKNPTIENWLSFIGTAYPGMKSYCDVAAAEDYFSWCGLTVGYCMAKAGIAPVFGATDTSRFLWAAAWMGWGTPVPTPQPGDVVVFDFGGNDHHVTLFEKDSGNGLWSCHGGNQGHQVTVSNFHKSNVMGIRRPIAVVPAAETTLVPAIQAPAAAPAVQHFNACVALVLQDEGGNDDDPRDPGGRTSRGITQADWNAWLQTHPSLSADVFQAPQDQIVAIYREKYWDKLSCDNLPAGVDYVAFDYGVLSGIGQSARVLQGFVGAAVDGEIGPQTIAATATANIPNLINQICDERIAFMQQSHVWSTFGKGWTARVQRSRAAALAMASAAAAAPQKPAASTPSGTQVQPQAGAKQMTPDEVAQVILSITTALAAQQGGLPAIPIAPIGPTAPVVPTAPVAPTVPAAPGAANIAPAVTTVVQILSALLAAQAQGGGAQQPVLNQNTVQTLVAALAKQLQQGVPGIVNPAAVSVQTPVTPIIAAPVVAGTGPSAMSNPSVQIGAAGLGIASLLQAFGAIAPPFSTVLPAAAGAAAASNPLVGTLATVIPLVVAGIGATGGWGSLLGIASSLIGAIGNAAKKP